MKNLLALVVLSLVFVSGFSLPLDDALNTAVSSDTSYMAAKIELEIAKMDYEKSKLQADTERDTLLAELSYQKSLQSYELSLKNTYKELLETIFDLISDRISLDIAKLQLENAEEAYQANKRLFEKSLISENDLKSSELDLKQASADLAAVQNSLKLSEEIYKSYFDVDIKDIEISLPENPLKGLSLEDYMANLTSVKIAELNLKIADYDLKNLSLDASTYEKNRAQLSYKKAKMDHENTINEAKKNFENSINSLKKTLENLKILKESIDLEEKILKDFEKRFEKGLISRQQLNTQKIKLLNKKQNYYSLLKTYYISLINLLIDAKKPISF